MSLIDKLMKNSKIEETSILSDAETYNDAVQVSTFVPMLNVAFSGSLVGGICAGITSIAGPSKHFKTLLGLIAVKAYFDKYPDAVCLFYDTEFGLPKQYLESLGLDASRFVHTPVKNAELLRFDIMAQLENIKRGDHVFIFIDSIGNLASKKEVEDALKENSATDMSRAKSLKGLFRMIMVPLKMKDLRLVAINHTYQTQELYSKMIMSGGEGGYYNSDSIFFMGRQQNKVGTELKGYNFIITVEKSRFIKEKSKIPICVTWDKGIDPYSGLMDLAKAGGWIVQSGAWYQIYDLETGELQEKKIREKDIPDAYFEALVDSPEFNEFIMNTYMIGRKSIVDATTIGEDVSAPETEEV